LEYRAVPVFIAGHIAGEFFITAVTEFKMLADGDFLELNGCGHRRIWLLSISVPGS